MFERSLLIIIFIVTIPACSVPQDPENSFNIAANSGLKVGVVENEPYTKIINNSYSGIEVKLIRKFAADNNLQVQFFNDSESKLIAQLEEHQLHIVIGGFNKETVWSEKAGFTSNYDDHHIFLIPKGENRLAYELEKVIFKR